MSELKVDSWLSCNCSVQVDEKINDKAVKPVKPINNAGNYWGLNTWRSLPILFLGELEPSRL